MKKWLFIGLGGLLLAMVIDGIIYYKKERRKMEDQIADKWYETAKEMHRKSEEFRHNADRILAEMQKSVDTAEQEIYDFKAEKEDVLKNMILENGETAQEWIDRVLNMDENAINLEMKIDP